MGDKLVFQLSDMIFLCVIGPLHGIPYGLKDTIAVPRYRTTWGSTSFKDQVLDIEAWVYKRSRRNNFTMFIDFPFCSIEVTMSIGHLVFLFV